MVDSPWSSGYMYPIRSFCSPDVESRSPTKRPIKTLKREVPGKVCDPFNTQSLTFFIIIEDYLFGPNWTTREDTNY